MPLYKSHRSFAALAWFLIAFDASGAEARGNAARWHCIVTDNFVIYTTDAGLGRRMSGHCESLRDSLAKQWLGDDESKSWTKCRCVVVVHPTAAQYGAAVGRGGERSSGCSTVRVDRGKLISRRIDVRADRGDPLTAALPHELTHVVLADRFLDRPLPRWADEGMAILADPRHKQQGHERDAQLATVGGAILPVAELLQLTEYPPTSRQAAFYGQSAALVKFLVSRGGPKKFIDFVDLSMTEGSDEALRITYDIADADALEREWRRSAMEILVARE